MIDNIGANITKRFHLYKRDITGLICEVLVPIILVLLGLLIVLYGGMSRNVDPRTLSPSAYPGPQRLLLNEDLISSRPGNVSPKDLFDSLNTGEDFTVQYTEESGFLDYYKEVYEQQFEGEMLPYRFGTYGIYQADTAS